LPSIIFTSDRTRLSSIEGGGAVSLLPSPSPNGGINTRTTLVAIRNRRLKMNKSPKSKSQSIAGRDGYVMAQALAYAIEAIEHLPDKWQEWSNKEDMKLLLNTLHPGMAENLRIAARGHIEQIGWDQTV
jgi:hypothetical protein